LEDGEAESLLALRKFMEGERSPTREAAQVEDVGATAGSSLSMDEQQSAFVIRRNLGL